MQSKLQTKPKSRVFERGYINTYSCLNAKERRQLEYKRRYKSETPLWDDTLVYLAKKFASLGIEGAVVLDAGCGNGNYVIDENRHVISWAVGVDVSKECTKKNVCLDEIQISQLETLPFEACKFDIVISLWVIEHLKNPAKVFKEIQRVLKPNGVFMFATPNSDFLPLRIAHAINSVKISRFINKKLFGREEEGVFPTFYKANTLLALNNIAKEDFKFEELRLNSDVSYTVFNQLTYFLSKTAINLPQTFAKYTHPHIIGVLRPIF